MMLGGGGNPSAWWEVAGARTGHDGQRSRRGRDRRLAQGNDWIGARDRDRPCRRRPTAWWAPVETISNSEERVRARLPGQRPAAVVAARPGRRGDVVGRHRQRGRPRSRDRGDRRVSRPRLVVHGHFYQPSRLDPVDRAVPARPDRRPGPRLEQRGSRPTATAPTPSSATSARISWDLGPTLAGWLAGRRSRGVPRVRRRAMRGVQRAWRSPSTTRSCRWRRRRTGGPRSAGACATSSCGSAADRPASGCPRPRSISRRFGSWPTQGVTHTILAPWQLAAPDLDTRRPVPGRARRRALDRRRRLRRRTVDLGLVRARRDPRRGPVRPGTGRTAPGLGRCATTARRRSP